MNTSSMRGVLWSAIVSCALAGCDDDGAGDSGGVVEEGDGAEDGDGEGGGVEEGDGGGDGDALIEDRLTYAITIEGAAYFSGAPSGETWTLPAVLIVVPTIDVTGVIDNGLNAIDYAIVTEASPNLGVAGALNFFSNTGLCYVVDCSVSASAIDIVHLTAGRPGSIVVESEIDENVARLATLNVYNLRSDIVAQVHNVLAGIVRFEISADRGTVSGEISLAGTDGFGAGTPNTGYEATFAGTLLQ